MRMTPNRRIALNIAATYARSLYKLVLGLVTARWLLLALGQLDYGLLGVVGGLVAFVTMINRLLSGAVSRYYAFYIGAAKKKKGNREEGIMECRRWFSAAVSVHTVIPLLLVAIGWPVGEYAVRNWLVIPDARLVASVWVWRFTCLSALTAMMNVPFRAMYTAKQEIAELTVYSMSETTVTAFLLYYMVSHPGDWLARYAFWHCLIALTPRLLIMLRAVKVYPECRLRRDCLWRWRDIREIAMYASWNAFGALGRVVRSQGLAVLVNLCFGASANAAIAVANRLSARANTFAKSLAGSFSPAIVTAYGAEKYDRMKNLVFMADKLSGLLVIVISVPLFLEVHEVMRLWLKTPPAESPVLCACVLVSVILSQIVIGQSVSIMATGKVALNRFLDGSVKMFAIPVAWCFIRGGFGLGAIVIAQVSTSIAANAIHVWNANRLAGISALMWGRKVLLPILFSAAVAGLAGLAPRLTLQASFWRVCVTTVCCEVVLLPLVWFAILDAEERAYVAGKFLKIRNKFCREANGLS